jgi:hypothetical protein
MKFYESKDRDANYVANRMRDVIEHTNKSELKIELMDMIKVEGWVKPDVFEQALNIYENNQMYYQKLLMIEEDIGIIKDLLKLEYWFMCIIEPEAKDELKDWRDREIFKLLKGKSVYCDQSLYKYFGNLPDEYKQKIRKLHDKHNLLKL